MTKLTVVALGLTLTIGTWSEVLACPRGGGGGGGYYGGYSAPRCNYRPVQPRPVQFVPQQQVQFSQQQQIQFPAQQQQQPLQALGGQASVQTVGQTTTSVSGGQQFQQTGQAVPQGSFQQGSVQQGSVQQVGGQVGGQVSGQQTSGQQAQQVQFTSQQQQQSGVAPSQQVAQQPVNNAPAAQNNGAAQAQLSAQQSALQALNAFGVDDAEASSSVTPEPQAEGGFHVGSWTAVLANNVSVQLLLQADGAFRWTANANGKASSFEGTYNLNGGSLQLNRSSDSQQLSGSFTRTNSGGFNFKLQGKDDAGLNFARN